MSNSSREYFARYDDENGIYNYTVEESPPPSTDAIRVVFICMTLLILIIATIIGNVFVMVAIVKDKNLNNISNYLVFSLALADLLVALLVMPMGAVYEVTQEWTMGPELCDMWTSCDVLCCTASILHLLAIAVDRYWAVTNVDYARNRSKVKIYTSIFLVWAISLTVSITPFFGMKDPGFTTRIEVEKRCMISQDVGYQIFATVSSFYAPLVLILILYFRIFQEARKRIRRRPGAASQAMLLVQRPLPPCPKEPEMSPVTTFDPPSSVVDTTLSCEPESSTYATQNCEKNTKPAKTTTEPTTVNGIPGNPPILPPALTASTVGAVGRLLHIGKRERKAENTSEKREKKAAKTLAIITGVFVMCWLPFFVTVLLMALCSSCEPDRWVFSFFLWLGYANSMLNPIIYTIFSPDFRSAFRRLLCTIQSTPRPNL